MTTNRRIRFGLASQNVCNFGKAELNLAQAQALILRVIATLGEGGVAGLQEIGSDRHRTAAKNAVEAANWSITYGGKAEGLVDAPIIWDNTVWRRVTAGRELMHAGLPDPDGKGPKRANSPARWLTWVVLEHRPTSERIAFVNVHPVAGAWNDKAQYGDALRVEHWLHAQGVIKARVAALAAKYQRVVLVGDMNRRQGHRLGWVVPDGHAGLEVDAVTHTADMTIDHIYLIGPNEDTWTHKRLHTEQTPSDHSMRWAEVTLHTDAEADATDPKPEPKPEPEEPTMSNAQIYPGANTTSQWFAKSFPGAQMNVNVGVLHSTEGMTWPSYSGGASAPTLTALPNIKAKRLDWRQHFPFDMSARALRNESGGVETNTLNAVQVELIGTCDPKHRTSWAGTNGAKRAGRDYIYWPDAPEWALRELAEFVAWCHREHGIKVQGMDVFLPYPSSYGASRVRMTGTQWRNFYGWCGHQHVPENSHGDPGDLDIEAVFRFAKEILGTPTDADTEDGSSPNIHAFLHATKHDDRVSAAQRIARRGYTTEAKAAAKTWLASQTAAAKAVADLKTLNKGA